MIQLSYSSVSAYQDCPKRYYWQKLRNLELNRLHFPFLIGNAIQYGIHLIFKKDKLLDPIKETMKFFEEEREKARRQFFITEQQEQQFEEWKCIVEGMLKGYRVVYKEFIDEVELVENEKLFEYIIDKDSILIGHIDNIVRYQEKYWIYELKTTNYLNPEYIKRIQTNFQASTYFHVHNKLFDPELSGFIFDVIRKPTIRQKKLESYPQFLERLYAYYSMTPANDAFYMEIIQKPLLQKEKIFNILEQVSKHINLSKTEKDFMENIGSCNDYGGCTYYDLCHIGENAVTMKNFKQREGRAEKLITIGGVDEA